MEDLLRIEWTQALNSLVRSCIGIGGNDMCSTEIITAGRAVSE